MSKRSRSWRLGTVAMLSMVALVTFTVVLVTVLDLYRSHQLSNQLLNEKIVRIAQTMNRELADSLYHQNIEKLRHLADVARGQPEIEYLRILAPDGRILVEDDSRKYPAHTIGDEALLKEIAGLAIHVRPVTGAMEVLSPVVVESDIIGAVQFRLDTDLHRAQLESMIAHHMWQGLLVAIVGILCAVVLAKRIAEPIQQLTLASLAVGRGSYDWKIGPAQERFREIEDLAKAFGSMLDSLRRSEDDVVEARKTLEDRVSARTQEVKESEARFRSLFEAATEAIHVMSLEGTILQVNPATVNVTGFAESDFVGKHISEVLQPESQEDFIREFEILCKEGKNRTEFEFICKDGSMITFDSSTSAIRGESGEIEYFVSFHRDISARIYAEKKAIAAEKGRLLLERQVHHTQKLESLGVLAGGIAHDFNNLLVGILGNADMALLDLPPGSPAQENLTGIEKAAVRATELCKQMLAYSGKGSFVIEPVDLSALVEEMVDLLGISISKMATLDLELADDLPSINADATQMRQVIMNLMTNASEAIGNSHGVISVSTGVIDCDHGYLRQLPAHNDLSEGSYVSLNLVDTGCGMDSETQAKIFDPFFTTKFAGRGLGLAAVQGIIRSHGGAIVVNSQPDHGTAITVLLPSCGHTAKEAGKPERIEKPLSAIGTVLLVDDEETVRSVAAKMLKRIGFDVKTANDGKQAIELLRHNEHDIILVLLDMTMPHMDGKETFREIRRLAYEMPIILSSGHNEQEATNTLAGERYSAFLQKPYRFATLRETIKEVLEPRDDGGVHHASKK